MTVARTQLDRAFNPRVIAVVGDKQMNGFIWLRALAQFTGKLYSVQIDPNEIRLIEAMGVTNLRSLLEVPEPVDYVVLAVPRAVAPRLLQDCVRKQVGAVTMFTSGFSETGDPEAIRLEQEVATIARDANLLLIGPNCMGIANPRIGVCNFPGMAAGQDAAGPLGFIGQSGTHTITACLRGATEGVGISKAVSFGNGIIAEAADYLEYLRDDPETAVIGAYIEGVRNGRRFYDVLRSTTPRKPVLLWKGGVTEAGHRAIFSHTAALATPSAVWHGMARQAGAISIASQDALFDVARTLLARTTATGFRAGLIAMTGGPSVAITDAFTQAGMEVPLLTDASYTQLRQFFQTVGGGLGNPLDAGATIAMGFRSDNLERLFAVVGGDEHVDLIALDLGGALAVDRWLEYPGPAQVMFEVITAFAQRSVKPFAVIVDAPHRAQEAARFRGDLSRRGVLTFASADRAAHAFRHAVEYWRFRAALD